MLKTFVSFSRVQASYDLIRDNREAYVTGVVIYAEEVA